MEGSCTAWRDATRHWYVIDVDCELFTLALPMKGHFMLRTLVSASALALVAAGSSFADDGDFFYSIGYSSVDITETGLDVGLGAITLRSGYEFTDHFGFEGQIDIGVNGDTVSVLATPVDVELNYGYSFFAVARAPVAENINLFARVGYGSAEVEVSVPTVSFADDADGFAWGVGGEMFFDERNGFRIEYTQFDFDNTDADVFGVSYVRRFGGGR